MDMPSPRPPPPHQRAGLTIPVVTLNGWTLPHRMNNGVKENSTCVQNPSTREWPTGWVSPVFGVQWPIHRPRPSKPSEGDRVRIYVTNRLPEAHNGVQLGTGLILPRAWTCRRSSPPRYSAGQELLFLEFRSDQIRPPFNVSPPMG